MYRNQALIDLTHKLLYYALRKTHLIETPELRKSMRELVKELQDIAQLKTRRMQLIERMTFDDERFRERYFDALLEAIELHRNIYYLKYAPPRPEYARIYKQYAYLIRKLELFRKYKSENL